MEVIQNDSKNRWMDFTLHNRNLSFKQCGKHSGFPGKPYPTLNTMFAGRLSSTATYWAATWLHVFVRSMGGPSRNQTYNHSLGLQIKKCIYTLLSPETTSNQFQKKIRRVEYTEALTEGHLGFFQIWAQLHLLLRLQSLVQVRMSLLAEPDYLQADEPQHMWKWSGLFFMSFISKLEHSSLARLQLNYAQFMFQ